MFSALIIVLILASIFFLMSLADKVKPNVTIEAGSPVPDINDFFIKPDKTTGKFITDTSAINTGKVGKTKIEMEIDGKKFSSILTVEDTSPPTAKPEEQYIFKGSKLEPSHLFADIIDATHVTCSFASSPDVKKSGWHTITVILADEGGNTANIDARFYVLDVIDELVIEAGTVDTLTEKDFIKSLLDIDIENIANIVTIETGTLNFAHIGSYPVILKTAKYETNIEVKIIDTVPPTAKAAKQYIFKNSELKADDLVTDIIDATHVTCSFSSQPDLDKSGWQDISVILTDEGGNTANISSRFYVLDVIDELVIEAGFVETFSARDFIRNYIEIDSLSLDSELQSLLNAKLGSYSGDLRVGPHKIGVSIKIVDTTPPDALYAMQYIFKNSELKADDLVTDIKDATQVTCSFSSQPDLSKSGWQDISVILTDEGGNTANISSRFYVFDAIDELVIEAGRYNSLTAAQFIRNYINPIDINNLILIQNDELKLSIPGSYSVTLKSGKYIFSSIVKTVDTTPPTADIKNCWTYKNKPILADRFVYNIKDVSPVTVRYKDKPGFSAEGKQTVYIVLEDSYKNASEYKAELQVVTDTEPPVIAGELNKSVIVGGTISYRSGITVTDDWDSNVRLAVDSGGVNLNKIGAYTVIYSATDESGNRAEIKGTITVRAVDMALVNELADNILAKIVNNNMSQRAKAKAIFDWINNKMSYKSANTPVEIPQRAYECFTRGLGDCYTYMAASRVLLTRAGIENLTVQRYEGAEVSHYWNLINIGEGWYHFDTCPTPKNAVTNSQRFMFTESQAQRFTEIIPTKYAYYKYDKSTVPEVVPGE